MDITVFLFGDNTPIVKLLNRENSFPIPREGEYFSIQNKAFQCQMVIWNMNDPDNIKVSLISKPWEK